MFLWLSFCSIMILMVCSALITEGFGKVLAAKVAGWSMLAVLTSTQVPKLFPELDGQSHTASVASYEWTTPSNLNYREVHPRINHTVSESPSQQEVVISYGADGARGIDFTPTCGGGEVPNIDRLDIAELSKQRDKKSKNNSSC